MKTMTLRTRMLAIASFFIAGGCFAQENFSWKELINETCFLDTAKFREVRSKDPMISFPMYYGYVHNEEFLIVNIDSWVTSETYEIPTHLTPKDSDKSYKVTGIYGACGNKYPPNVPSYAQWNISPLEKVQELVIPSTVREVLRGAFARFTNLKTLRIPKTVTTIETPMMITSQHLDWNVDSIIVEKGNPVYDSRENCNAIIHTQSNELIAGCKNTTIPSSIEGIGPVAFYRISNLKKVDIPDNVKRIGALAFCNSGLESVTIGSGVKRIPLRCFEDCDKLTDVVFSEGLDSIDALAFFFCESLKSVHIPRSTTYIAKYNSGITLSKEDSLKLAYLDKFSTPDNHDAFLTCTGMTSFTVEEGNPVYDSRNGCNARIETKTNKLIKGISTSTIPESVKIISAHAFLYGNTPKEIYLPDGLELVEDDAIWARMDKLRIGPYLKSIHYLAIELADTIYSDRRDAVPISKEGWRDFHKQYYENKVLYIPEGTTRYYQRQPWCFMKIKETNLLTGMEDVEGQKVVCRRYFTIEGKEIHAPIKGVFIEKLIYENGTSKSQKVYNNY